jgi:hypothetical protein
VANREPTNEELRRAYLERMLAARDRSERRDQE